MNGYSVCHMKFVSGKKGEWLIHEEGNWISNAYGAKQYLVITKIALLGKVWLLRQDCLGHISET